MRHSELGRQASSARARAANSWGATAAILQHAVFHQIGINRLAFVIAGAVQDLLQMRCRLRVGLGKEADERQRELLLLDVRAEGLAGRVLLATRSSRSSAIWKAMPSQRP